MRFLRVAIVYVLLGFGASVAVAWALAAWMPVDMLARREAARYRDPGKGEGAGNLRVTRFDNVGSVFLDAYAANEEDPPDSSALNWPGGAPEVLVPRVLRRAAVPWTTGDAPWPGAEENDIRAIDARGWPMLCLWSEYESGVNDKFQVIAIPRGAISLRGFDVRKGSWMNPYVRTLPYRPLWTGLVVNVLCYGVILAILWFLPGTIRAIWRRRRGVCAGCGYQLRDLSKCPECGVSAGAVG